jgi:ribosomal protein S18 acetylase RimI-like enzyme
MNIRAMTQKDKPAVMKMLHHIPEFTSDEVDLAEEVIDTYLCDPKGSGYFILVAERDSSIVGYVCYGNVPITDRVWEAYWLGVDHNLQGQGLGRKLMGAVEESVKKAGGRLLVLDTSSKPEYDRTNEFYLRLGYKMVARIKDFYMVGDDRLTYEKRF